MIRTHIDMGSAWYVAYALCVLLEGGFEAGFLPWGISGEWLLSAVLLAGWSLPLERYVILSLSSAAVLDILQASTAFTVTKLTLAIVLAIALLRRNKFTLSRSQLRYLLAMWLLALVLLRLTSAGDWRQPAVWVILSLSAALQFIVWNQFLSKWIFLPSGRQKQVG